VACHVSQWQLYRVVFSPTTGDWPPIAKALGKVWATKEVAIELERGFIDSTPATAWQTAVLLCKCQGKECHVASFHVVRTVLGALLHGDGRATQPLNASATIPPTTPCQDLQLRAGTVHLPLEHHVIV